MDFDRTLFDTDRFVGKLWEFIATEYGPQAAICRQDAKQYLTYVGDLYDYDFFAHLESIEAITDDDQAFVAKAKAALSDDFLYDDARSVIPAIDTILSFGNSPYQEFKLSFCPELANIPTTLVLMPKGQYIKQHYDSRPTVLVDDKAIASEIEPPAMFIQLDRSQLAPAVQKEDYWLINSLEAVEGVLRA